MTRRGAHVLVESLLRAGTRKVFTLSGNHIMPLFDAAIDTPLELVHVRHEAAAVHMADAWSRVTGEVGIAMVTGGPGHVNALSALITARALQSPVVLLSGHAPLAELGRGAFQEMPQREIAAPLCKASWLARSANEIGPLVAEAIRTAAAGVPGPVHVSLPSDLLEQVTEEAALPMAAFAPEVPDLSAWAKGIAGRIAQAERPLIIAGGALGTFSAESIVAELRARSGVPFFLMESPRGTRDASLGRAREVLAEADLAILLGKHRDFTLEFGGAFARSCEVIETADEVSPREAARALARASRGGSSHRTWAEHAEQSLRARPAAWAAAAEDDATPMHPLAVCAALQRAIDAHPNAILVADGGEFCQWVQGAVRAPHRLINGPAGAIGPGIPFALAAKLACPDRLVIVATGDGTFGFHPGEFDTAVRYGIPVIAIVGNDARWNAEYQIQVRAYGEARARGCELLPTRYDRVVEAFGGHGEHVRRRDELDAALSRAVASGRPACIDVSIAPEAAPRIA